MKSKLFGLISVILLSSNIAFAGQSIVLTTNGPTFTLTDPLLANNQSWRIEFQVHNLVAAPPGNQTEKLWYLSGTGAHADVFPDGSIDMTDVRDQANSGAPCKLQPPANGNVLIRLQRDLANSLVTCEMWNNDGTGYTFATEPISGLSPYPQYPGGQVGLGATGDLAFLRVFTNVLPLGSRPPTTADGGNWTELKFDGNLSDSSGSGHNASGSGATYIPTPGQVAVALPKTYGAPSWSAWSSLRAGYPAKLDGSASFTLADSSSSVSYFWTQLSGPTIVRWQDRSTPQPVISGLVFGDYVFQLTVTDATGSTGSATLETGAVATDNNGVVISSDPRIDQLFGPMIAFGKNPWAWFDYSDMVAYNTWAQNYQVNGGTWRLETDQQSVGGFPRSGAVWVSHGATSLTGAGSNFSQVFCGGGSSGPGYTYIVPLTNNLGAGVAPDVYGRVVQTCNSDTQVTFPSGWNWANPTVQQPGVPWATFNLCTDCGSWASSQQAGSNLNYYDNSLAHYALYYRSGWKPAQVTASWLADRWYRSFQSANIPRDLALTSAILHAVFDQPTYNMWPTIRQTIAAWPMPSGPIQDVREQAYIQVYTAWQALFDPDPTKASNARAALVTDYTNVWGPQQQPTGNYINDEFEGDAAHLFQVTQGSDVATLVNGSLLPANYCNTVQTSTGTISVATDGVTVTGSGTNFAGTGGMFVGLSGTLNGQPWTMISQVSSTPAPTATTMTLVYPWRGDPGSESPTKWIIWSAMNNGYWEMFFASTDANNSWTNLVPDTDSFYWCSVTDGSHLRLSTAYTGDTSGGNVYRRPTWQNLTGRGSQPFMQGIVAWAMNTSAMALDGYNATVAAQYRTVGNAVTAWITNYGTNPATGGLVYGAANFSNCRNLTILPAYDCAQAPSGTGSQSNSSNERSYLPEVMNSYVWRYMNTKSPADQATGDAVYTRQWAHPGYASPFPGDGNFAQLADVCCLTTKSYGQVYGMGQGHQWPAARLGGAAQPQLRSILIRVRPEGGMSAQIVVTAPSGAKTTYSCGNSSECSISVDDRQGSHWYQIQYRDPSGRIVSRTDPDLLVAGS